ncbi:MAG: hypothetical protein R2795_10520 [Saprospiraceae bacterium]
MPASRPIQQAFIGATGCCFHTEGIGGRGCRRRYPLRAVDWQEWQVSQNERLWKPLKARIADGGFF